MAARFVELDFDKKVAVVVAVLGLVAIPWAYIEFLQTERLDLEQRQSELRLKTRELNHAFAQRQIDTCFELSEIAARVALMHGEDVAAIQRFEQLYWGASAIISAGHAPGQQTLDGALAAYDEMRKKCGEESACWDHLRLCVLDVAHQCTRLICNYLDTPDKVQACRNRSYEPQCR